MTKKNKNINDDVEAKRLKALSSYNVLDTPPEKEYDAINRLASYICQTPISLITFIDDKRQWYKSKIGMDANEIPLVDTFCKYTILHEEILEITNTLEDERVKNHPFVIGEAHIRFYAGIPLIDPDGNCLGTFCVIDTEPRKLTAEQRDALKTLAGEVISHIMLKKQKLQLEQSVNLHEDFHRLFNISPEIHYIADVNSNIEIISDAVKDILGYDPHDTIGKSLWNYVVDNNREQFVPLIEKAVATQQPFYIETQVVTATNSIKWIGWSAVFKNGKWYASGRDITESKKTEKDLKILSFVARKSPTGMLTRNKVGEVVWMNEAMERMTGYSLEEMKGRTFGNLLFGEGTNMEVLQSAIKAREQNKPFEVELLIYKKDRTPIWISSSNSPLFDDAGDVERQISTMQDITERKNAEEQLKLLSLVASNTTSGVVINNGKGEIEWVNDAFTKITGYSFPNIAYKHLGDILQGELTDLDIVEKARELSKKGECFEVDMLGYRKDGEPIWLTVINSVILDDKGAVDKYIEVIIDISAKKKVEQKLIESKEEAVQLNRAKDMFISVMSHEIRTPLNAVIGMSHILSDNEHLQSQAENLNILKFSAQNLMALINDVLDFTKIETGNVELEKAEVDLRGLVKGIISSMQYKVNEKNITLTQDIAEDIPEIVIGDSTRLSQILLNLVSNAIKFTDEGGVSVKLKVVEKKEENVKIRFYINDTGIGIASNKLNTIFESFKQAEADTTRKYGGTGLGLAISKRLVELHNSRINVDSVKGTGSTFWFTITFNRANKEKKYKNKVDTTLDIKVLVVDDNQINRLLINKILTKWGVKTEFAENGVEAIEKIEATPNYDVILMDLNMPKMGGIEAVEILRAKPESYFQQLYIIALTASILNPESGEIGGMNDYILKPFEPAILFEKLSKLQN